ncbi:hypothetical protein IQ07DRAFT_635311 [Pyrenochaeta sp. DS3sAY3a]|nr:hypothetical protein IQ07DRAFT_635311 [Pyrenochaeta sp. DS3sAY3a]
MYRIAHHTSHSGRRLFSTVAYSTRFPATLLRLNAGSTFKKLPSETDGRVIRYDGSRKWMDCIALDRATLGPNTFSMQEIIRTAVDNYYEDIEDGSRILSPFIFTIPKGTRLPDGLILLRESIALFSLHSSQQTSPEEFDDRVAEFFTQCAVKQEADAWLDNHLYEEAAVDENEGEWMG